MPKRFLKFITMAAAVTVVATGCSSGPATRTVFEAGDVPDVQLDSVLVIAVAGSLNHRAQFERRLTSEFKRQGVEAHAYHAVADGAELSRDAVVALAANLGVEGVLVTRETASAGAYGREETASSIKATAKGDSLLNLYRYDYEVLNEPAGLALEFDVSLATDVYSAASESLVWTGESSFSGQDNIEQFIDTAAIEIAGALRKSGLIGR